MYPPLVFIPKILKHFAQPRFMTFSFYLFRTSVCNIEVIGCVISVFWELSWGSSALFIFDVNFLLLKKLFWWYNYFAQLIIQIRLIDNKLLWIKTIFGCTTCLHPFRTFRQLVSAFRPLLFPPPQTPWYLGIKNFWLKKSAKMSKYLLICLSFDDFPTINICFD